MTRPSQPEPGYEPEHFAELDLRSPWDRAIDIRNLKRRKGPKLVPTWNDDTETDIGSHRILRPYGRRP